jgi:hypothetical protein
MELAGWILLGTSWTALSGLVYYCMRRVLQQETESGREPTDEND